MLNSLTDLSGIRDSKIKTVSYICKIFTSLEIPAQNELWKA